MAKQVASPGIKILVELPREDGQKEAINNLEHQVQMLTEQVAKLSPRPERKTRATSKSRSPSPRPLGTEETLEEGGDTSKRNLRPQKSKKPEENANRRLSPGPSSSLGEQSESNVPGTSKTNRVINPPISARPNMKLLTWCVGGLDAAQDVGAWQQQVTQNDCDLFLVQDLKIPLTEPPKDLSYKRYISYSVYSNNEAGPSLATFAKNQIVDVYYTIPGWAEYEPRTITLEFPKIFVINVQAPVHDRQEGLKRLFSKRLLKHAKSLLKKKSVIIAGNFESVISSSDTTKTFPRGTAGDNPSDRSDMEKFLAAGFVDAYRKLHPNERQYTVKRTRRNRVQRRHDFCLVSADIAGYILKCEILESSAGHSPVLLEIAISL